MWLVAASVFSLPAATLDATLLDASDALAGVDELELAGVNELAIFELDGAIELLDEELETGGCSGFFPPPPLPPQAVNPATINERAQVLIRDCIVIPKLRCCYRRLGFCGLDGMADCVV